uniref:EthD domain-containing protein n=1 Tax=Acrobeloides nanus TaxID=290746 RepID=A0A914DGN6_9BILA
MHRSSKNNCFRSKCCYQIVMLEDLDDKKKFDEAWNKNHANYEPHFNSNNSKIVIYEDESCVGESQNSDAHMVKGFDELVSPSC